MKEEAVILAIDYLILDKIKKKLQSLGMVMEFNIGLMGRIMRDNGLLIKLKGMERFGMLKETYIKENLGMIWQMDMENIHI